MALLTQAELVSEIAEPNGAGLIWSYQALPHDRLPSLTSTLFGAFQVIDSHFSDHSSTSESDGTLSEESYVDFGFGSDQSSFAGVHRFALSRGDNSIGKAEQNPGAAKDVVRITHSGLACNPSQNKPIKPRIFFTLHMFYAMLLFREGVAQILNH
jgi:hypothetical protein